MYTNESFRRADAPLQWINALCTYLFNDTALNLVNGRVVFFNIERYNLLLSSIEPLGIIPKNEYHTLIYVIFSSL